MSRRLAYVVSRFPRLSETFILREILELRRLGREIDLYAIQHEQVIVRHPEVTQLADVAHYLEPASARTLAANARWLARSPGRYGRLLGRVVRGNLGSADFLTKGLAVFPGTIALAEQMRRRRVRHIHAHFGTHPALVALLASEIVGTGFSFTVHAHDLFVDTTMLAEKVRHARLVVAISEFNRRRLCELAGTSEAWKIVVVRCGVDTAAYRFRPRAPSPDGSTLLAVGSLQEYKGHDRLVRACALLRRAEPERRFVCNIVGDGPLRPRLEELIERHGLGGTVRLLGAQDQHAVRALMEQADLMVLPSVVARDGQMEGIPVVLMEAMALGTPVIASNLSGIPELVRDRETGLLVRPGDPAALRDAVLECWREPATAADRARRARELVERDYDLATNVARLAALFDRLPTL